MFHIWDIFFLIYFIGKMVLGYVDIHIYPNNLEGGINHDCRRKRNS